MPEPPSSGTPVNPPGASELPPTREMPDTREGADLSGPATDDRTRSAPPLPDLLPPLSRRDPQGLPEAGERLGDFELVLILGAGSFARVYLARQLSLGREVALKVSRLEPDAFSPPDEVGTEEVAGEEARTLAGLAHDHIVQVYSEVVFPGRGLRLLCMQYVPGATLGRVLQYLAVRDRETWTGRTILEALDTLNDVEVPLDPMALKDRELLGTSDFIEAACWLGERLALALAHAHALGVQHRDVKPANILLNRYGRPLLADFNVASSAGEQKLGGTLAYMAPEHLDAFNPDDPTPPEAVDHRADLFSLGLVLFELLTGRPPFPYPATSRPAVDLLRTLADQRRTLVPRAREAASVPEHLDRVLRRCLAPDPADRYASGTDLARALEGCRELHAREKQLPPAGPLTRLAQRHPFTVLAFLALVPHFLGSVVNISYNELRIIRALRPGQQAAFWDLVLGYNLVIYPICLVLVFLAFYPIVRGWRLLALPDPPDPDTLDRIRAHVLRLPGRCVGIACLGWLPGAILFPLGLHLLTPPVSAEVYGHFITSFTISGLIALTYTLFGVQYVCLRVLYPRLQGDPADAGRSARAELRGLQGRLRWFQFFAVLIPTVGAALMVGVGPEQFSSAGYRPFRLLVTALLALGMGGLGVAVVVSGLLGDTLQALRGREHPER